MIKNIIFDLGDVFINLDNSKSKIELLNLGIKKFTDEMIVCNKKYEKGLMSTIDFLTYYKVIFSNRSDKQLMDAWNSMLIDFPKYRLSFLENFPKNYRIFLLSNTNELHIDYFKNQVGYDFYSRFVNCFEKVYYSYQINNRKPEEASYGLIMDENNLKASETLFIDDSLINIASANNLGLHTWHLIPEKEDVVDLFVVKKSLFDQEGVDA